MSGDKWLLTQVVIFFFKRSVGLQVDLSEINDDFEEVTIKAILSAASTSEVGDGKIFVSDVNECYRIRTGEKGGDTLNQ